MSVENTKDIVLNTILHRASYHIYSKPNEHKLFGMKLGSPNKCSDGFNHNFETKEHQYGLTMIITSYCLLCGYCQAEVIPNVSEKKVLEN
jgi:hypothetical protein